jgi:DNA-binding NarL/FixJ family response regulator
VLGEGVAELLEGARSELDALRALCGVLDEEAADRLARVLSLLTVCADEVEAARDAPLAAARDAVHQAPSRPGVGILVVDELPVVRQGLRSVLADVAGFEVVAEASSGAEALRLLTRGDVAADVVVLDVTMNGADGIAVTRRLRQAGIPVRVVALTVDHEPGTVSEAIAAGVDGYLLKTAGVPEIAEAIRRVAGGERVIAAELTSALLDGYTAMRAELTRREAGLRRDELSILEGIADGLSYRELAKTLYMSEITVRRRVQNVYRKLDVTDRAHAVAVAMRRGLM